jgi:hypothetical protein
MMLCKFTVVKVLFLRLECGGPTKIIERLKIIINFLLIANPRR